MPATVLDSHVLLAFLRGEVGDDIVAVLLEKAGERDAPLHMTQAVRMSVFVVRAFVKMRGLLGGTKELARQLRELESKLTARLDGHEAAIVDVLQRIMRL